jgi:hypothetical protein
LYVNAGIPEDQLPVDFNDSFASSSPLYIGKFMDSSQFSMSGELDEVLIFRRALWGHEVSYLHSSVSEPNLERQFWLFKGDYEVSVNGVADDQDYSDQREFSVVDIMFTSDTTQGGTTNETEIFANVDALYYMYSLAYQLFKDGESVNYTEFDTPGLTRIPITWSNLSEGNYTFNATMIYWNGEASTEMRHVTIDFTSSNNSGSNNTGTNQTGNNQTNQSNTGNQNTGSTSSRTSGGGGPLPENFTHVRSMSDFSEIDSITLEMRPGDSIEIRISQEKFKVTLVEINSEGFTVSASGIQHEAMFGEEAKFDLTGDGYYDLAVSGNNRGSNIALTLVSINEESAARWNPIAGDAEWVEDVTSQEIETEFAPSRGLGNMGWIAIAIIAAALIAALVWFRKTR